MAKLCMFADLDIGMFENILNWNSCDLEKIFKEEEKESLKLTFELGQNEQPISSDTFLVLEGSFLLKLAYQSLITENVEKICKIPGNDFGVQSPSIMFKFKKSNILVAAIDTDPLNSDEVTELLRPYADLAKNTITVHTKSMVDFRSEEGGGNTQDLTIVRGINSKFSHIKELQAPNMISGVAAGIASWRAFQKLPVSSYVYFVRHIKIDDETAKNVIKLLRELGLKDILEYTPKRHESSLFT